MLFLLQPPVESRFLNKKQVVCLTLPYGFRGYKDEKARLVHGIKKTRKTVLFDRNNKLVDRLMALISFLHPEILAFFSYLERIKQLSNLMWLEKKNKKIS